MKDRRMVIFLLVTTTVCTLVLALANLAYERAANIFNVRLYGTILELFRIEAPEGKVEEVFLDHFEIKTVAGTPYYVATRDDPGAVVFKTAGSGLWSRIELLLAVKADRQALYGLRVLSQAETPGLGGRIAELAFQEEFRDVGIRPELGVVKFAMRDNEVDAISGATKTSGFVQDIINRGIRDMDRALAE